MTKLEKVTVERLGGLAGFGLPGSALKSVGEVDARLLSEQDAAAVEALFRNFPSADAGSVADDFRYRLTRSTASGEQSIEVPASALPPTVASVVRDSLA